MSKRQIDNIDAAAAWSGEGKDAGHTVQALPQPIVEQAWIELNYPDPTPLAVVLRDVAKWSGFAFVMESHTNVRVQIFSANKLSVPQAYELFLAALAVAGLRAVQSGRIVKIVPPTLPMAV